MIKLFKGTLISINEPDKIEKWQTEYFRPHAFTQCIALVEKIYNDLKQKHNIFAGDSTVLFPQSKWKKQWGDDAYDMLVKLDRELNSNAIYKNKDALKWIYDWYQQYDAASTEFKDALLMSLFRIAKITNRGLPRETIDDLVGLPFTDGTKHSEVLMKKVLVEDYNVPEQEFQLLYEHIYVLPTGIEKLSEELDKKTARSIDAISERKNYVVFHNMKYAGGTIGGGGSTQDDQKKTESFNTAGTVEKLAEEDKLYYNNKPVVYISLLYGNQMHDPKRVLEVEHLYKGNRYTRSFACSLSMLPKVYDWLDKTDPADFDLDDLYTQLGEDIEANKKDKKIVETANKWNTRFTKQTA